MKRLTPKGRAIAVMTGQLQNLYKTFQLKGKEFGSDSSRGEGYLAVLRLLALEGEQTVPQLAQLRGVSRQRIQKIVDEMQEDGMAESVENPAHRRSRLIRLSKKGKRDFDQRMDGFMEYISQFETKLTMAEIKTVTEVLERLDGLLKQPGG